MKKHTKTWYRKKCVNHAKKEAKERDNNKCVKCGKSAKHGYVMHGSHVYPEGTYKNMSALPINIITLCYQCHFQWWHKHIIEAGDWYKKTYRDRAKKLLKISNDSLLWNVNWEQEYTKIKSGEHLSTLQSMVE